MHERGEESPIDIYPELDEFEELVYKRYNLISQMKSGEGLISSIDYLASSILLDMEQNIKMLLPIFIKIDYESVKFSQANNKRLQELEQTKKKVKK